MKPNEKPIVFAYSGQGSQYYQMGAELLRENPAFRAQLEQADAAIERSLGYSLLAIVHGAAKKHEPFDDIRYTSLSVFLVEYALTRWLEGLGIRPSLLFGYSIGEVCAHVIAGSLSFESAVRLIARQAEALLRKCPRAFMAAVLGKPAQLEALRSPSLHVACRNSAEHWVVTGALGALAGAKARAESLGLIFSALPVRYGFHSALVDAIEHDQRLLAAATPLSAPALEVVSCAYGESRGTPNADYFWDVVRRPIDLRLAALFVASRHGDVLYVDVGPSGTLSTLLKPLLRSLGGSETVAVLSPMNSDITGISQLQRRLAGTTPQPIQDGARRVQ